MMRVTLQQWLHSHDIPPENGMAVVLATDDLKPASGSIIGMSFASYEYGPKMIYLRGAQPERNSEITGISQERYAQNSVSTLRAIQSVQEILDEADFFVTYSYKNYFRPWLLAGIQPLAMLSEFPVLDLVSLSMLLDAGMCLHDTSGESLFDLCDMIDDNVAHLRSDGYNFGAVYSRVVGKPLPKTDTVKGGIVFEDRVTHLLDIYRELLLR